MAARDEALKRRTAGSIATVLVRSKLLRTPGRRTLRFEGVAFAEAIRGRFLKTV